MQGFTTHSSLETLRLRLCVTNIAIRCKTLHNPMLVMCYSFSHKCVMQFLQVKEIEEGFLPLSNFSYSGDFQIHYSTYLE